ncbi:MAG: T9SS type A sorting domain-containing protein [Gemmatimonadetes bacterium]|nr:T9SS type A sorting domain-containing protein [Gemmatimonadota bacterium]
MRVPMRQIALGLTVAALLPAVASAVELATSRAAMDRLTADRAAGTIDEETYLLEAFRFNFAPEKSSARYVPQQRELLKCFTPQMMDYSRAKAGLSQAAVDEIEGYLNPASTARRATYISPGGNFEFTYFTTGANAVSATDVSPANGIPDFVERCAEYMDESWDNQITTLGFTAPALGTNNLYEVSFAPQGSYGFTSAGTGGQSSITLHNTFLGFPANTDPDGNQLGAAKVTCAHEFKHGSQFTNNGWSEGGWVELDATWVEDITYDATNDYYNYINFNSSNSQLSDPWLALDNGGTGLYEDCLWQHFLSEKYGNQIIVDLWDRRAAFPTENMKQSYQQTMMLYGTEWDVAWPEMYEWAWFTGSRAEPPFGFGEATSYLRMNLRQGAISSYPSNISDAVDQIAAHPFRFNPGTTGMNPQIAFNGEDAHLNFTVSVIVEDASSFTITQPALDANQDFTYVVPQTWDQITYVGVIVTNSKRSTGTKTYTLDVTETMGAVDVSVSPGPQVDRLQLHAAAPNPFRAATDIRFSMPRDERATVRILDVAGRTVRVLQDGVFVAGENTVRWDGRNNAGVKVPAGVYWSRVETAEGSVARKIVAVR